MRRMSIVLAAALVVSGALLAPRASADDPLPPSVDNPANGPILSGHEPPVADEDEDAAGEIAVDVRDDVSDQDLADLEHTYGLHANSTWSHGHDNLEYGFVSPADEAGLLDRLAHDPRVEHAEPMEIFRASFVPNDPMYGQQWHLKRVGAEQAWEYTCGQGATVAVVDTGVACFDKSPFSRVGDLGGTRCEGGYNFVHDISEAYDDQGHGTHVAGTVAQTTNNGKGVAGLAYCATVMPVKVLNRFGWGTLNDVAEGIRYAADHGAQVINLSLGGPSRSSILEDAIDHALSKGVVVVAAAGNSGRSVGYPAAYDGVLAVSATDSNDNIAWFSSRGPQVGIAAPGVNVTQQTICNGGRNKCEQFAAFNGTSMATPHVAGAAAMMVALGVSGPDAVRNALASSATPKGEPNLYGAGRLDAASAASHVWWRHLWLRAGALLILGWLIARRIRKQGGQVRRTLGSFLGALLGAVGLAPFLPAIGVAPGLGPTRWLADLAMRPLGEWDIVWSAGVHRWLPLASALPVVALTLFAFGMKRARPFLGGLGLGTAALITQIAVQADVAAPFGSFALRLWVIANAIVCLWIARAALDAKKA